MPNDPGLTPDTCIYMEAITGDGGVHNGNDTWWLSPDIKLTGHSSGLDNADPGQDNSVEVRLHRKAADSGCTSPFSESVTVELWVGNPALAMTPNNPASTKNVENIGTPMPAEGATATQPIVWHPPTGLDPSNPQSPGHKCLIARCYPDSMTAVWRYCSAARASTFWTRRFNSTPVNLRTLLSSRICRGQSRATLTSST